ncbi:hypothetical protein ACH494_35320, partial [Micromonospora fulviviridis]
TNTHPKHAVALGAAMLSSDTHTARSIPPPRRPAPDAPTTMPSTTTTRTGAPSPAAEHDSGEPAAPAVLGAPALKAGRGAKQRTRPPAEPAQPVTGPAGDTHPADLPPAADVPPPARRRWSRLAIARVVVALVAVVGLLSAAMLLRTDTPSDTQAPSPTPGTLAPSVQTQTPSATPRTSTPSNRPRTPSATPRPSTPSGRPTLKLEDVQVQRPSKLSTVRTAAVGTKHLIDRSPVFTSLPAPLTGAVLIPGASDDKRLTTPADYLVFNVTHDATVYAAFDRRGAPEVDNWWPAWLNQQGFKRTDMIIPTNDKDQRHFVVFAKKVPAGRVTLGPNSATSVYSSGYITLLTANG